MTENDSQQRDRAGAGDHRTPTQASLRATRTPNRWIPSPEVRRWLFRVLAAAGPLVVFYGIATADEVALWVGLGGTILGTPGSTLAAANVPRD